MSGIDKRLFQCCIKLSRKVVGKSDSFISPFSLRVIIFKILANSNVILRPIITSFEPDIDVLLKVFFCLKDYFCWKCLQNIYTCLRYQALDIFPI